MHHKSGAVHFSKDGQIYTSHKKQGTPLDKGPIHIFTILVQGANSFPLIEKHPKINKKRSQLYPIFLKTGSIKFVGHWVPRSSISFEGGLPVSPFAHIETAKYIYHFEEGGKSLKCVFFSPPHNFVTEDYVLQLSVEFIEEEKENQTGFVLMGGFDTFDIVQNPEVDTKFLLMSYPVAISPLAVLQNVDFIQKPSLE